MLKILAFLNLLDDSNRLSITNIALIGLLIKMCVASNTDWPSMVAVITAFGNYAHKRVVNSQGASNDDSNGPVSS